MRFLLMLFMLFPIYAQAIAEGDLLEPQQAFKFSARVLDADTIEVRYQIAEGYHLYRDKLKFEVSPTDVTLVTPQLPPGKVEQDAIFGHMVVYRHDVKIRLPLKRGNPNLQTITLKAVSQGCADAGVCYPPQAQEAVLQLAAQPTLEAGGGLAGLAQSQTAAPSLQPSTKEATSPALAATEAPQSESSRIENLFKGGSFWLIVSFFFGAGLLLALTPCVFPMIPILSGIIAGQGQHLTKRRAFALSLSYVLGMAMTYALVGIAAGLSGSMLSAALQNPWVLGAFALIFVVLAFSMFGFYELQLPNAIQSKFSNASNKMKGGSTVGVFVMGVLSAVIVGPCVAAPLAGALLYIGQTHNVWLGGSALFAMALGMGVPLILVGVSAGALLPKAGGWMNAVKSFFGVLLLGVAIWLISPVIPDLVQMLLWAALLIVSAIYLSAVDPLPLTARGFSKFWKGVGMIALVTGISLLIGALSGSRDILQPLAGLHGNTATSAGAQIEPTLKFERVKSVADLETRIKQASGKFVMLDFYADWCVSCKEFERFTFSDARVRDKLKDVVLLQADVTANNAEDKALLKKFSLFGPPGIIFFDKNGNEVKSARTIGYLPPDKFLDNLNMALR
ncbi:thiol:disulfide interchange protein DsbD [Sulfuriferula plumbiphila]|uniref:Thiol:disulfide interchange protein DsbD n=2 Tax=Sulfuriferula plumbiphila TaxID=171865 RepID=A0A512L8X9_9PROT|nr:protein-disulfide reductase DsbD [Sulfuriferula plumbiphila]BBP04225.1 thiol:disulfide interchange protein DsbD [Sulfuriferula plumbiphila]GEP30945.1 thiol:disulfide interchange protein DsbD [Sulfuriferula plumbiphila]